MESSTMCSVGSELTVEEREALASQVLEIIGGIVGGHVETTEEPEEKDLWSLEEGDDSVFYSDEEQPHQDLRDEASSQGCQRLTNSVANDGLSQQMDEDPTEKGFIDRSNVDRETTRQLVGHEGMNQMLETAKTEELTLSGAKSTESEVTAEKFKKHCGEMLRPKVNQVKEEEVQKAQTPDQDSIHEFKQQSQWQAEVPKQRWDIDPLLSTTGQLAVDQEAEQHPDFQAHAGFHQNLGSGHSTLPLMKKPGHQKTFNHLSSSKYSTVSYRRIRRGNTRQKIEEFEHFMQNK